MSSFSDWLYGVWDEEFGFREKNPKRRLNIKVRTTGRLRVYIYIYIYTYR